APAPDPDPRRVHVRQPADRARRRGLVLRLDHAHLPIDQLAPGATPRAGATIVDAGHDVAALRQHLVPEIVLPAPGVRDRLRSGPAIDIKKDGIAGRRIEIRRLDEPGVELDAAADVDLTELGRAEPQTGDFRFERGVVHDRADQMNLRQAHERPRRLYAVTLVVVAVVTSR